MAGGPQTLLFVSAVAVCIAAVWMSHVFLSPGPVEYAVPTITVEHQGQLYRGETGGPFCWQFRSGEPETCVSYHFDPETVDEIIEVLSGAEVRILIDATTQAAELTARLFEPVENSTLNEITFGGEHQATLDLDVPAGTYILNVRGSWEQGEYQRAFKLHVRSEP